MNLKYRLAGNLVGLVLALVLSWATVGIEMSDLDHFLLGLVLGLTLTLGGGIVGGMVGDNIESSRCEPKPEPICLPRDRSRPLTRFCSVCGSVIVTDCRQTGFDEKTGVPVFNRWLHCPRWLGGQTKFTSPISSAYAVSLTTEGYLPDRLLYYWGLLPVYVDYQDCKPEFVPPVKKAAAPRTVKP